ncbi:UDP-glucose 4-epimerase [Lutibacter sp. Hel_I_33_5]|uniref:NAD-dependent epimerase/dehydratase family protein n=1 Tax=Lutibacter sp. Hel_I_33_5 TaxID=1566289 RepID=UPI0011AD7C58|nr:NAD(P)-dependent oxidoreductase [Lutibacter sp. Hel_I_33_5]TVZ55499.1 UDP-glucose 4-epimerase [Lutibacter sp. Hel_I_33_5]
MKGKVVVFGGSGFLGSHVADLLSDEGYSVKIFDLNISKYLKSNQEMIIGDISSRDQIKKAVKGAKFVYHFAAIADIKEAQENPVEAVEVNILSTTYILDACREFEVERFVYGSTIYVYSEHGSFYRSTKQASELIIENYQKIYNLNFTILRYGSLYGPRANHFNFINRIIIQAIKDKKIVREGNGQELREYIHIKDAARASVEILSNNFINANIMITGTKSMRIRDVLEMIKEMFNDRIEVEYTNNVLEAHYNITPYTFKPKVAKKYQLNYYHDLGQGVLDQIYYNYERLLAKGEIEEENFLTKE